MTPNNAGSVSIIIATLNREKVLISTINSVLSLTPLPDEIWVIDQTVQHGPDVDLYLKSVQERGVRVIKLPKPGVCFARNLGAALSNADILIYIDDDVILDKPEFVDKHKLNFLDPKIDAVQGQIFENGIEYFKPSNAMNEVSTCLGLSSGNTGNTGNTSTFVTANVSIRRSTLLEIGGFDEGFSGRTYANEDGDLGLRLVMQGYRIVIDTAPSLIHLKAPGGGNRITGRDSFPEWTRSVTFFQFALRHMTGWQRIMRITYVFRLIAFRKENFLRPWNLPTAMLHALYALVVAIKRDRVGFHSSLINPGPDYLRQKYQKQM